MKKKHLTLRQKRAITGFLFIVPWFIGFLIYYVRSLILTTQFSFSNIEIAETGGYTAAFCGLDNYKYIFLKHESFSQTLVSSVRNILIDVPFVIFFSLFIAILLNSKFKGRGLVRAIFFIPILLGSGAVQATLKLATQNIMGGSSTAISDLLPTSGVNASYFIGIFLDLGFPMKISNYMVDLIGRLFEIVRGSSIQIIIFIAALQSVSASLYEVSKIEGATSYETFWKITFPMVSPLILTNVVYTIVDSFINSGVITLAYKTAFPNLDFGISSAMTVVSTIIVCFLLVVIGAIISRKTFYYN